MELRKIRLSSDIESMLAHVVGMLAAVEPRRRVSRVWTGP